MKNIYIIFCCSLFLHSYAQDKYTFYVELDNYLSAPKFNEVGDRLVYAGKDIKEASFFAKYNILEFYQAFPDSKVIRNLNFFTVSSTSENLIVEIIRTFPSKYLMVEDITNLKYELANTYPNDYGSTSPITNLGVNASFKNLDYINAPKAWDYSTGSGSIVIGISDGEIDVTDADLQNKTSFVNPAAIEISHGTNVTSVAAAQGNNGHGMSGICQDCSVLGTRYGDYNNLLQLAYHPEKPAKIINMSWGTFSYCAVNKLIIDELYDYGVILVAASHNINSQSQNPDGSPVYPNGLYSYPASYDHVISVLSVNFKNTWSEEVVIDPNFGEISRFVEDMISPSVVTNYQGNGPYAFGAHTTNEKVDICAPGYRLFRYYQYFTSGVVEYQEGGGTSIAAPHVSGTIGLMVSVNPCLTSDEVDDILKLTSKNLEVIPGNERFAGESGAGKLEAGDAVEFVYKMKQSNGNAVIDGQDFYRFDFKLKRINNKLTISNQIFRDSCTVDFTAKNIVDVLPETDFKPNDEGFVDLKIDTEIDTMCNINLRLFDTKTNTGLDVNEQVLISKLYPNPNNGSFSIQLDKELDSQANIEVYDIYGKLVHKTVADSNIFNVNIDNLSTGVYIVRLSYNGLIETIKFIRE